MDNIEKKPAAKRTRSRTVKSCEAPQVTSPVQEIEAPYPFEAVAKPKPAEIPAVPMKKNYMTPGLSLSISVVGLIVTLVLVVIFNLKMSEKYFSLQKAYNASQQDLFYVRQELATALNARPVAPKCPKVEVTKPTKPAKNSSKRR